MLEVYATPGLAVTRVIGPVTDIGPSSARSSGAGGGGGPQTNGRQRAKRVPSAAAVRLSSVEGGASVSVLLDIVKALQNGPAYLQVRLRAFCCLWSRLRLAPLKASWLKFLSLS
jgi:hypothetical protein